MESEEQLYNQSLDATEPLTGTHIEVASLSAEIEDFLEDERRRKNDRQKWINTLCQQKAQREVAHKNAIEEQNDLHAYDQAKIDAQLRALGYNAPEWVEPMPPSLEGGLAGMTGKPAKRKYTRKAATTPTPTESKKGGKAKRTMSAETKAKMAKARADYWQKRKAAEAKVAKKAGKAGKA